MTSFSIGLEDGHVRRGEGDEDGNEDGADWDIDMYGRATSYLGGNLLSALGHGAFED